jgi:hypothetical protein
MDDYIIVVDNAIHSNVRSVVTCDQAGIYEKVKHSNNL